MPNLRLADLTAEIEANVRRALAEDIGSGDITARLIPAERLATASIITREAAVISGTAWVDCVFRQLDPRVAVHWQVVDGERVSPNQVLFHLEGPARSLLSGERSALNFLQLLSGVATHAQSLADQVADTGVKLLDTRKTLPGLRMAQKYAVTVGGGVKGMVSKRLRPCFSASRRPGRGSLASTATGRVFRARLGAKRCSLGLFRSVCGVAGCGSELLSFCLGVFGLCGQHGELFG